MLDSVDTLSMSSDEWNALIKLHSVREIWSSYFFFEVVNVSCMFLGHFHVTRFV